MISLTSRSSPKPLRSTLALISAALFLALPTGRPAQKEGLGGVHGKVEIRNLDVAVDAVVYLERTGASARERTGVRSQEGVVGDDEVVRMDQFGLQFSPHVLVIPVGTVVEFTNSDDVLHNIFAPAFGGEAFDLGTWPKGERRTHRFDEPGISTILCNVHPEMEAYIVVVPTEHYAQTGEDGGFRIEGIAAGTYILHAWHERCHPLERIVEIVEDNDLVINPILDPIRAP